MKNYCVRLNNVFLRLGEKEKDTLLPRVLVSNRLSGDFLHTEDEAKELEATLHDLGYTGVHYTEVAFAPVQYGQVTVYTIHKSYLDRDNYRTSQRYSDGAYLTRELAQEALDKKGLPERPDGPTDKEYYFIEELEVNV